MAYISTETVKSIREQLKQEFPGIKFSVRKEHHSSVYATILESELDFTEELTYHDEDTQETHIRDTIEISKYHLDTYEQEHKKIFSRIFEILRTPDYYDRSDSQIDYFDTSHYYHLNIGSYDKPYNQRGMKIKDLEETIIDNGDIDLYLLKTSKFYAICNYNTIQSKGKVLKKFTLDKLEEAKKVYNEEYLKNSCEDSVINSLVDYCNNLRYFTDGELTDEYDLLSINLELDNDTYSYKLGSNYNVDIKKFKKTVQENLSNAEIISITKQVINKDNNELIQNIDKMKFEFFDRYINNRAYKSRETLLDIGKYDSRLLYDLDLDDLSKEIYDNQIMGQDNIYKYIENKVSKNKENQENQKKDNEIDIIKSELENIWKNLEVKNELDKFNIRISHNELTVRYHNDFLDYDNAADIVNIVGLNTNRYMKKNSGYIRGFDSISFLHKEVKAFSFVEDNPTTDEVIAEFKEFFENVVLEQQKQMKLLTQKNINELTEDERTKMDKFWNKDRTDKERFGNKMGIKNTNITLDSNEDLIEVLFHNDYKYSDIHFPSAESEEKAHLFLFLKHGSYLKHITGKDINKEFIVDFILNKSIADQDKMYKMDEISDIIYEIVDDVRNNTNISSKEKYKQNKVVKFISTIDYIKSDMDSLENKLEDIVDDIAEEPDYNLKKDYQDIAYNKDLFGEIYFNVDINNYKETKKYIEKNYCNEIW